MGQTNLLCDYKQSDSHSDYRQRLKVNNIVASEINKYERSNKGDGSGDLRLKETIYRGRQGISLITELTNGLWGIADVKGAAEAINTLRTAN